MPKNIWYINSPIFSLRFKMYFATLMPWFLLTLKLFLWKKWRGLKVLALGSGPRDTDEHIRWWETEQNVTETIGNKIKPKEACEKIALWVGENKYMWMLWNRPQFIMMLMTVRKLFDYIFFFSCMCNFSWDYTWLKKLKSSKTLHHCKFLATFRFLKSQHVSIAFHVLNFARFHERRKN